MGEVLGYAIGVAVTVLVALALIGGMMIGVMAILWRLFILRERWARHRAESRAARFLAEREARAQARPVRNIDHREHG